MRVFGLGGEDLVAQATGRRMAQGMADRLDHQVADHQRADHQRVDRREIGRLDLLTGAIHHRIWLSNGYHGLPIIVNPDQ